jgi:hypothetical protein
MDLLSRLYLSRLASTCRSFWRELSNPRFFLSEGFVASLRLTVARAIIFFTERR